ncbi:FixH family protein [Paenibacillus aquistagni]|uniref:YtkA-like n=1 Tax=Paenibacillus aquistagni TaxID=1852522 RepID=A0A1X7J5T8_9BACL|nr:FixH family protein [Paenibacillus aquistagni]SMG22939.1 YtkA-like [Paenibacillus aquistagni]
MNTRSRPIRKTALVLAMTAALALSACTANTGLTDEKGLLPHLTVDIELPEAFTLDFAAPFHIRVEQHKVPVDTAEVTFEIWPENHPEERVRIPGESNGKGLYTAEHQLSTEGIYIVRCHVVSGSLEAMPAKRFAIGEEAVLSLAELEEQQAADGEAPAHGGGHDHH